MSLDQARAALSAASQTADFDLLVLYTAAARVVVNRLRKELDAFEMVLAAREAEMVRQKHGDAQQLDLGGAKR
jgi:hypothetical protein